MGKVVNADSWLMFSLTALAREFEVSRETLRKRIDEANVSAVGAGPNGYPLFRVRDIHKALARPLSEPFDPDTLEPFARRAFYQAQHERLRVETASGELLSRIEVERETARLFEIVGRFLDTLPDNLEREGGMPPRQVQKVENLIDGLRTELYKEIVEGADSALDVSLRG